MRYALTLSLVLAVACGEDRPASLEPSIAPPSPAAPSTPSPSPAEPSTPSPSPTVPPIAEPSAAPSTPSPPPAAPSPSIAEPVVAPDPPATAGSASCEGLVASCGGWVRCVHVRPASDAGDGVVRFEGLGEDAGHTYFRDDFCHDGVCNDMCDPVSGACRHGVREDVPIACSRAAGPSPSPFYCELAATGCVRHELPPGAVHGGGRS